MEENVQASMPTTRQVGVRFGLIMGIISIIIFLILAMTGANMNGPARWVSVPILIVMIVIAHKQFKDNGDGYMSYGQGIGIAFWMTLVSSVISSVFTYIYAKFIDASFIEAIKAQQIEEMGKKGMSDEQIDQAMKIASMFMTPEAMFIMGIIFGILFGIIIALIVTIFTQKSNPQAI